MNADLLKYHGCLQENEQIITKLYHELEERDVRPDIEAQLGDLRKRIYEVCHLFAVEVEPYLQRTLHKSPLSFGLFDRVLEPSFIFNSPWAPMVNMPTNVTTTTNTSTPSQSVSTSTLETKAPSKRKKKAASPTEKSKQKRIKWSQEDKEAFAESLKTRGRGDLAGIAADTGKTTAEVRAHINKIRLDSRRAGGDSDSVSGSSSQDTR